MEAKVERREAGAGVDPRLRVGDATVDARDAALLRAVADCGSLSAAAAALERSYSRAHSRVAELEESAGRLVERERGGADGGGSRLTDRGRELLARFDRLTAALDGAAATERLVLDGRVCDREGEVAVVDTPAGRVRALALVDDARVRVSLRADAVTLHAPAATPATDETSARNRLEGTVTSVDRAEATARVTVDVGADAPLVVRVTTESLDRLDLVPGDEVVAAFKATATRATATYEG